MSSCSWVRTSLLLLFGWQAITGLAIVNKLLSA